MIEVLLGGVLLLAYLLLKEHMIREERQAWTRERRELLNRIKPETAVPIVPENARTFDAVPITSDDEYWTAREERLNSA